MAVRTQNISVPLTPRLEREAKGWRTHGRRPTHIETPGPEQESVWDYPRPPAVQRVLDEIVIEFEGEIIARSSAAVRVCETASPPTYYLPAADFVEGALLRSHGSSGCEWKGRASYWSVRPPGSQRVHERVAWSYDSPYPEYTMLAGLISLYPGAASRITVGGAPVSPQPGSFYGGWITPDLTGPFKGEPGSTGW